MLRIIYSTRIALFIHEITSAKRTHEVQPALFVRESSTQLVMYSLDTCIPIFKSQKGSMEALNFQVITSLITSNRRKVNCYWECNEAITYNQEYITRSV